MNIKEHIEAGAYPKDEKGRALVPTQERGSVAICAIDAPGRYPIVAFSTVDGSSSIHDEDGIGPTGRSSQWTLLPPTPHKVTVRRWVEIKASGTMQFFPNREPKSEDYCLIECDGGQLVLLTGEYDVPTSSRYVRRTFFAAINKFGELHSVSNYLSEAQETAKNIGGFVLELTGEYEEP